MIGRRSFLTALGGALVAAPAIVRAGNLVRARADRDVVATVNASYQSGHGLVVNPLTETLHVGDMVHIDEVMWRGRKRRFVITATALKNNIYICFYPPLVSEEFGPMKSPTVTHLPRNRAAIRRWRPLQLSA